MLRLLSPANTQSSTTEVVSNGDGDGVDDDGDDDAVTTPRCDVVMAEREVLYPSEAALIL